MPLAAERLFCKNPNAFGPYSSLSKRPSVSILAPPPSGDPLSIPITSPPNRAIGSLWRRIVAFVVDGIIIGAAGTVIALPFFERFSHLGPWGRLVGFCL